MCESTLLTWPLRRTTQSQALAPTRRVCTANSALIVARSTQVCWRLIQVRQAQGLGLNRLQPPHRERFPTTAVRYS
jgi:hypothetical protein